MRNLIILLAVLCASCGTALPTIKPYKLEVQQGNVVTSKMLLQLRPGMTKSQVRFIMGTPLIQDSFHGNRWDYVYQMRESGKVTEQRRVILDFENDLLKTVRGDVIPSAGDKAVAEENIGTRVINPSAKPEEKSLMSKLKFWQKDEAEIAKNKALEKAKTLEKEKLDADEAAKKASSLSLENATSTEKTKVILTEPPEILPLVEVPVINAAVVESAVVPVEKPVAAQVEIKSEAAVLDAVDATTAKNPVNPENNVPVTGLKFDRILVPKSADELASPPVTSGAGNKASPKPKDLPVESSPSFFDKMLEKIGF